MNRSASYNLSFLGCIGIYAHIVGNVILGILIDDVEMSSGN